MLDADEIYPNVWMGAHPHSPAELESFDVWVPCAVEMQPSKTTMRELFPTIYRCPLWDDGRLTKNQAEQATTAAHCAARHAIVGEDVLITCQMGMNRSGLVTALILRELTAAPIDDVIALIRAKRKVRPYALRNSTFLAFLRSL